VVISDVKRKMRENVRSKKPEGERLLGRLEHRLEVTLK
jgi:hypothetical protein